MQRIRENYFKVRRGVNLWVWVLSQADKLSGLGETILNIIRSLYKMSIHLNAED
jgi:hypothetical protein